MDERVEHTGPSGVAVLHGEGRDILELPPARVRAIFRETGALWLRGFKVGPQGFLDFIQQFSRQFVTLNSPERRRHWVVDRLQSVTGGSEALNFHTELGSSPRRPEYLAFLCEAKAQRGGQTLLVDGVKLWKALPPKTRAVLENNRVCFKARMPFAWWTDRLGGTDERAVKRFIKGIPDVKFELEPDGTLVGEWVIHAAFLPRFGTEPALATNLFPYVVPGLSVRLENGDPIPAAVTDDLCATANQLASEVQWENGELVFVDNTRWLHGRRAVGGLGRRVQMLMGFLNFKPTRRRAA